MSRRQELKEHRSIRRKQRKAWCFVYILRDPKNGSVRYVGQTRLCLTERLRWHYKAVIKPKGRLSPVQVWIAALLVDSSGPLIELIDGNGQWDISEAVWIDRYRRDGAHLLNVLSVVGD